MSEQSVVAPRFIEGARFIEGPALAVANFKGIYPPLPTFFDTREELDLATYQQHISNLAGTGIAGYVVMGTNGESVHLTSDERLQVIEAAREAADSSQVVVSSQRGRLSPIAGGRRLPEPMPRLSCHLLITRASWIAVHW